MIKLGVNSDITALIKAFEEDRDLTISNIYTEFRSGFMQFGKKYSKDENLAVDCFQEAVISLYENLAIGKITDQNSTIKTYLYAIGKHKILSRINKENHQKKFLEQKEHVIHLETSENNEHAKQLISTAFDQLGERCQEILTKFYYKRFSIEAIMINMNYKNENTVKAHKSRCMSQLREIFKSTKHV